MAYPIRCRRRPLRFEPGEPVLKTRAIAGKLPPGVECIEDAQLFVWRPLGVLNEAQLNKILTFVVEQERKFGRSFDRFTDMSALDGIDLTFKYVFHFALYRRLSRLGQETIKSAFLVTDVKMARYVKLHALMTDRSPLQVAMFKDRESAARWLGRPLELLLPRE